MVLQNYNFEYEYSRKPRRFVIYGKKARSKTIKVFLHKIGFCHKARLGYNCKGLNNYKECG